MNLPSKLLLECARCNALHRVPIQHDENGAHAYIETKPCAECGAALCSDCPQFTCDCERTLCITHGVAFEGMLWCPTCIKDMMDSDAACGETPDPVDQETAQRLAILAESGCTLEETRAVMNGARKEVS